MKMLKGIVIDVQNKTVQEVEKTWDLYELQKLVGGYIDYRDIDEVHSVIVNEEGLLTLTPDSMFFQIGNDQPLVGNGIILGTSAKGNGISVKAGLLDKIKGQVKFLTLAQVQRMFV